jgi:hypothetical protein
MDQARVNQGVTSIKPKSSDYRKDLVMHHEYDMVEQSDSPRTTWLVRGHAGQNNPSPLLICESEANFGQSKLQLSTYLALCQYKRKIDGKAVSLIQGFGTDGRCYSFQRLHPNGSLHFSPIYDIGLIPSCVLCRK